MASSDESYMPHVVVVSAGRDIYHLTEIIEVKVPSQFTGNFVLVENMKTYFPVVQLNIKRCYSDGCDTRVRQVKAIGYRYVLVFETTFILCPLSYISCMLEWIRRRVA